MELSKEEIEFIEKRRKESGNDVSPRGFGVGREWAKAKLNKKKFIDEATFIEKEGN